MATVVFASDLQRFTAGVKRTEVAARNVRDLYAELRTRYPGLGEDQLARYSLAIDGALVAAPLLERFGADSELVFVARLAAG